MHRYIDHMKSFLTHRIVAARNVQIVSAFAVAMMMLSSPALAAGGIVAQTDASPTAPQAPVLEPADQAGTSSNWAGYVAEGDTYTGVHGSWVVATPSDTDSTSVAADATWVGIGGVSSHDLIQAGTQAIVQDGVVEYEAWFETLPDYQTKLPIAVHGGDSVSVSLSETSPDNWLLVFSNNTTGKTYQKNISYSSSRSSAEWIEEMPIGGTGRVLGYLPLDNFGTAYFTNAGATVNGTTESLTETGATPLAMYAHYGDALATPSVLGSDGKSFTVARADSNVAEAESTAPSAPAVYVPHHHRGGGDLFYIVWQI
jgi:hypothetical protein